MILVILNKGRDEAGSQLDKMAGDSIVIDVLENILSELFTSSI
ncbi:hypothetical protein [Clostridium akagii]|nr:hypothetical protein [Clostridium akagii]